MTHTIAEDKISKDAELYMKTFTKFDLIFEGTSEWEPCILQLLLDIFSARMFTDYIINLWHTKQLK